MQCTPASNDPILIASSTLNDAELTVQALAELGTTGVTVLDAADAVRMLCADPTRFAAVVVGERVGRASGMTLCGVARDAGLRVPMLLLTGDDCRWTAVRAARLQTAVMWKPAPAWRIAHALRAMLPRRFCGGGVRRPLVASAGTARMPSRGRDGDYWRRPRSLW